MLKLDVNSDSKEMGNSRLEYVQTKDVEIKTT